ncbi:hypothetical protein MTBBW1_1080003 [Desulfamplus magnetovallimortis]|uniref:HTH luxR-type domain-containing protein n=1 Tax=Desulfamplus magnetovallimortis TaxID=1246637 RepID=A0A1W1H5F9_9BACT|nr:helix-turn-helix transcriptional regulator [Desulfamplus magnetovallimortis]SLM27709.1 hypothetical protein MTBBW1_1080003 [Desulfamplus magnetovallimortis]
MDFVEWELFGLTPTEAAVVDHIMNGKNSDEIALVMKISIKTVSFHRLNIRKKLGISYRLKIDTYDLVSLVNTV